MEPLPVPQVVSSGQGQQQRLPEQHAEHTYINRMGRDSSATKRHMYTFWDSSLTHAVRVGGANAKLARTFSRVECVVNKIRN